MSKRILIMAAGTGGHVFPALAIGLALREKGAEVCWLGTDDHLEKEVANTHGFEFFPIAISGLRGKGVFKLLSAPFQLLHALFQSMRVVLKVKPDVVLGFGGFVAGPGGLAAWLLRRKLVIHEQNAVFGFTNKILSYFSSQVFTGFSNTLSRGLIKARCKHARWIGNPIRDAILKIPVPLERFKGRDKTIRLLVMGGSLGARVFNQVVPEALALLDKDCALEVWHHGLVASSARTLLPWPRPI